VENSPWGNFRFVATRLVLGATEAPCAKSRIRTQQADSDGLARGEIVLDEKGGDDLIY
jgi:hypothetical protein